MATTDTLVPAAQPHVLVPRRTREVTPRRRAATVAVVLGTRPEIVKLAQIVSLLGTRARVIHTGQHYDEALNGSFLRELGLPEPALSLRVGGSPRGVQIGTAVAEITRHLLDTPTDAVIVQGDTNAALAGALAANATGTPLLHVEAGLRSFDRAMPEEHNRVAIDHLADRCCAPTAVSASNLVAEGVAPGRISVTGNTVVEAVRGILPSRAERLAILRTFELSANAFVLATFHRPENVDDIGQLLEILRALRRLPVPVLLPLHPRTAARVRDAALEHELAGLRVVEPLSYPTFLAIAAESACLVSDSGGLQEEASVLKRPVAVVRVSTERPEVLGTFSLLVSPGHQIDEVVNTWLADVPGVHARLASLRSPYGDGDAARLCVEQVEQLINQHPIRKA